MFIYGRKIETHVRLNKRATDQNLFLKKVRYIVVSCTFVFLIDIFKEFITGLTFFYNYYNIACSTHKCHVTQAGHSPFELEHNIVHITIIYSCGYKIFILVGTNLIIIAVTIY